MGIFIEGERWSNKEAGRERERERMTCVLFLVLDISENMAGTAESEIYFSLCSRLVICSSMLISRE